MAAKAKYRNDDDKKKWLDVLNISIMSSDDSDEDNGEDVIIVHPLPWLASEVVAFKSKMDEEINNEKTSQARRQTKRRVIGVPSLRPEPPNDVLPS